MMETMNTTRASSTALPHRNGSRPDMSVSVQHVLSLRVGCWRPPVHVTLPYSEA